MNCGWANLLNEFVDQSDVSESSSSHDLIISSSGSIGVEVSSLNTLILKVSSSRGVLGDLSSWGDMVSSDGVSQVQDAVSSFNIIDRVWLSSHSLEERWVMNVG